MSNTDEYKDFNKYFEERVNNVKDLDVTEQNFLWYIQENISVINEIMNNACDKEIISATTFNDFYKFKMFQVITKLHKNLNVTFSLDLRDDFFRNLLIDDVELQDKIYSNLSSLKDRKFIKDMFNEVPNFNIDQNEIDDLCSHSLIDSIQKDKFICCENNDKVVVSMYKAFDCILKKERIYIEATGPWYRNTWLETTMMQVVYETLLRHKLKSENKSYGTWIYESMFRCFKSIKYANNKDIKCALFSGRRSGGYCFLLLQNLMMTQLYNKNKYLGTSSVDSWYILKTARIIDIYIKNPIGTHAHELSMVFSKIYESVDDNLVLSQLISHYCFYMFSNDQAKIPMLPDTLGTNAFMRAATMINIDDKPFIDIISSARKDSGTMEQFINTMDEYNFIGNVMDSEIGNLEDLDDLDKFKQCSSFGAGGFFGDSLKVFDGGSNISMAVKVTRVYIDNKILYPIKLGDGTGKVSLDTSLDINEYNRLLKKSLSLKNNNRVNLQEEQDKFNAILSKFTLF